MSSLLFLLMVKFTLFLKQNTSSRQGCMVQEGNYRPVALTSIASKLMEINQNRVISHIEGNDLFTRHQHGFRILKKHFIKKEPATMIQSSYNSYNKSRWKPPRASKNVKLGLLRRSGNALCISVAGGSREMCKYWNCESRRKTLKEFITACTEKMQLLKESTQDCVVTHVE